MDDDAVTKTNLLSGLYRVTAGELLVEIFSHEGIGCEQTIIA